MLTKTIPNGSRAVRTFEVITPAGRVYQFPHPSLKQRLIKLFFAGADIAAISVVILVLSYVAGFAAEYIDGYSTRAPNG